jgi:hypothetical protein
MTQQKAMKPVNVQGVADTSSIKDDNEQINLYNIPNPHVDGYLLVHLPKDNILWVTDLVSPRGPVGRNPGTVAGLSGFLTLIQSRDGPDR